MFIHNINPVLFGIGPFQVRYYGIAYALGFLIAYWLLNRAAKAKTIKNFDEDKADTLILYVIIGVVLGSRIFEFIFYEYNTLLINPLEVFYIWHGGMSFHGGLIGIITAVYLFSKKYHVKFYPLADVLAFCAAFALTLGRIANFINGELVGRITTPESTPWCVVFPKVDDACRHPSQLYEAGYTFVIFITLYLLDIKKKFKEGTIFWAFVLLYGLLRFIFNFWRDDPSLVFGISTGQALSLIMVPIAAYFLIKINFKGKE